MDKSPYVRVPGRLSGEPILEAPEEKQTTGNFKEEGLAGKLFFSAFCYYSVHFVAFVAW